MVSAQPGTREISRIELMVHPFFDLYEEKEHISAERLARMVEKWKQRVREVAADPNAVLVVVKGKRERGDETPDYKGFEYRSKAELQKMLAIERDFYGYARKCLERRGRGGISTPGNRLFLGFEDTLFNKLDSQKFKRELSKRKMRLNNSPVFWLYGSYTLACVPLEFLGVERRFRVNAKSKVVPSLCLSTASKMKNVLKVSGYRPRSLRSRAASSRQRKKSQLSQPHRKP